MPSTPGHLIRLLVWLLLALVGAGLAVWSWPGEGDQPVYPGRHWSWMAPERAGYSAAKLNAFSRHTGGSGCIAYQGRMIYAWGDWAARGDVASVAKPLYAFLAYKAVEQGRIGSLDDLVADWVPDNTALDEYLKKIAGPITFRQLLDQTSGYGLEESPGEAFAYNDYATYLCAWLLFDRVWEYPEADNDAVLNGELLGGSSGFEDQPTIQHRQSRPFRLRISSRDLARFGLLYLRGGRWRKATLLRADLFASHMHSALPADFPRTSGEEDELLPEARTVGGDKDEKHHLGSLGQFWWFNRVTPDGHRLLPDAPEDTFFGSGYGGRFALLVIPSQELVVAWQDIYPDEDWIPLDETGRHRLNQTIRALLAARVPAE